MSTENLIRGIHTVPLRDFIHSHFDADTQHAIYADLSEETRQALESVGVDDWHPVRVVSDINRCIYEARGNPELGYGDMVKAGEAVGAYGVSTFMRLLIKLMTPEMLAKKWPTIWKKSHNFGRMEAELDDPHHLTLRVLDVSEYHHIGPTAVGFLSHALKAMGKSDAKVIERDLDYTRTTATNYGFDVTW